jgi:hypothetical protein
MSTNPTTATEAPAMLPTYYTLQTIAADGTHLTDQDPRDLIIGTFPGTAGRAFYGEALALAHTIRTAEGRGWAIVVDGDELAYRLAEHMTSHPVFGALSATARDAVIASALATIKAA